MFRQVLRFCHNTPLKYPAKIILNIIAIIYVVFDEVFISISTAVNSLIQRIPSLELISRKIKEKLVMTNKYLLLLILIKMLGISELIGFFSFIALAKGSIIWFCILYIIKFIPFFIMSYIFNCTKDILLEIKWFNYCYTKICVITDYLKSTTIVIKIKEIKESLKNKIKSILGR